MKTMKSLGYALALFLCAMSLVFLLSGCDGYTSGETVPWGSISKHTPIHSLYGKMKTTPLVVTAEEVTAFAHGNNDNGVLSGRTVVVTGVFESFHISSDNQLCAVLSGYKGSKLYVWMNGERAEELKYVAKDQVLTFEGVVSDEDPSMEIRGAVFLGSKPLVIKE